MSGQATNDSHFSSSMNLQDLLDMSNTVPEACATALPKSNGQQALAVTHQQPPPTSTRAGFPAVINYEDCMVSKMEALLQSNALADVTLIVGEERTVIHAHKLILGLASPVFTAMFYGELASQQERIDQPEHTSPNIQQQLTSTTPLPHHNLQFSKRPYSQPSAASALSWQAATVIEIPDCTPQAMRAFLKYIYTNGATDNHRTSISVDDALSLLYAARKYSVRSLEDQCVVTLSSSITAENVFDILYAANVYNLTSLDNLCWEFIEENPIEVLNTHSTYLAHETIQSILKNEKLNCREVELFQFLMKWVEQECVKMNLELTPENIRRLCAAELKLIRFPIMSGPEFADIVVPTGVLTVEQIAKIFTAINTSEEKKREQQDPSFPSRSSVLLNGMEFSSQKRTPNKNPTNIAQTEETNSVDRPPVFTFIAEQQIRNRDQQMEQNQNQLQSHHRPVNGTGGTTAQGGNAMQLVAAPIAIAPNNDVVGVVDYSIPGIIVPLNVPSSVTQAAAGERARSRQRQTRRSRRRIGSSSSDGPSDQQQQQS